MRTWIFQGNPRLFDIRGYLAAAGPEILWRVRQYARDIKPNDEVFIWQAIGDGDGSDSGALAKAEVLRVLKYVPDDPISLPFWKDATEAGTKEDRARLRVLEVADAGRIVSRQQVAAIAALQTMRVLTMPHSTNFLLTPTEVRCLNDLWSQR